jgi:LPXTG-motif cell wall-anchored protein
MASITGGSDASSPGEEKTAMDLTTVLVVVVLVMLLGGGGFYWRRRA